MKVLFLICFHISFSTLLFSASYSKTPTLNQTADKATDVVAVKLINQQSYPKSKLILTDFTFTVINTLKGNLVENDNFILTILGGSIGNVSQTITGSLTFSKNEESILFLKREKNRFLLADGVFSKYTKSKKDKNSLYTCKGNVKKLSFNEIFKAINSSDSK